MSIPKKIYQSWKTKEVPEKMKSIVELTQQMNLEYEYELWDDADCRKLLLDHFGKSYADAFDILIPGAFKCDFWRYAVLYVYGGIYMDMDMTPQIPFRDILRDDDQFVSIVDMKQYMRPPCAIYQAFIACRPRHPVMLKALEISYHNIISRRYDMFTDLGVTGPVTVGIAMNLFWGKKNTHDNIVPGEYPDGVRLFEMNPQKTWDLQNRIIFLNKFEGYKAANPYAGDIPYYKDNKVTPRATIVMSYKILALVIILLLCISIVYLGKYKRCQISCAR